MKKVVVTGMGTVNSLGGTLEETWESLKAGKCGINRIQRFDPSELETQIAAEVLSDSFEEKAKEIIRTRHRKQMTRLTRMMIVAADEAVSQSKIEFSECDRTKAGVFLGVTSTGYNTLEKELSTHSMVVKEMANAPAAWLTMKYGLEGPSFSLTTACASSSYCISLAVNMIRTGMLDVAIVGGTDSHVQPDFIQGFNQILALSVRNDSPKTASRPFTKSRDGFVMGEGAGAMILESEESARRRNAVIYVELAGTALTSEAFDITAPKADGAGMCKTMEAAIKDAGISKDDIQYINAHGTSTYLNDKYETMAIKNCFGERAKQIPVSSSKSMLGHTVAAAGVIEGIITVMTIHNGILTPTINYLEPDEELDLDYVPNQARKQNVEAALSNSFGFGGHNATLVFRKMR